MALPSVERFMSHVTVLPDGCWRWDGARNNGGYGMVSAGDQTVSGNRKPSLAHRVSYRLFVGEIPDQLTIDHLCCHTWCVNPAHLEAVSFTVNMLRRTELTATHCRRGHEFTDANTYVSPDGKRRCRKCHRMWEDEHLEERILASSERKRKKRQARFEHGERGR